MSHKRQIHLGPEGPSLLCENFNKTFSNLDSLGRCGVAEASIGTDLLPTEKRGSIGMVKPSGWHTVRYDDLISDKFLWNIWQLIRMFNYMAHIPDLFQLILFL